MKLLKKYLLIIVVAVAYYLICNIFNITCPIKYITGMPCPTCGMTRAMLALVRLDIKGYIEYNPMALFMCLIVFLYLHREHVRSVKIKKWIDWSAVVVLAVNSTVYVLRLIG